MDEPIEPFSPPRFNADVPALARAAREWLGHAHDSCAFEDWKQKFEEKGIFVFITSKFKGWSKVDLSMFRGFSICKNTLPIIVINDSDAKAAQSFTLWHELGHLLRKESAVDSDDSFHSKQEAEVWCNRFAGEALMPEDSFAQAAEDIEMADRIEEVLVAIDKAAKDFKVSSYACALRMLHLRRIRQEQYKKIKSYLEERHKLRTQQRKEQKTPLQRNIAKEKLRQYGGIYSRCIMQAYHDQEIGLHRLCQLFGIKKSADAKKLEGLI